MRPDFGTVEETSGGDFSYHRQAGDCDDFVARFDWLHRNRSGRYPVMIRQRRTYAGFIPLCLAAVIACTAEAGVSHKTDERTADEQPGASDTSTLKMPAALASSGFGKFAEAIKAAGLTKDFENEGPFTCFAPTDEAFNAMPDDTKTMLRKNPAGEYAQAWIKYHFVKGVALKRNDLEKIPGANGYADKYLRVWVTRGEITINKVCKITRFDIQAGNGLIHEVGRVLDATDEINVYRIKPR